MVEYVYALHDFAPEHDDEVSFRAGELIEIVEKDDLYGDGWWKGRNLAGKIGLFPESYTQPAPASAIQSNALAPSAAEQAASAVAAESNHPSAEANQSASVIRQHGSQLQPVDEEPEPPPTAHPMHSDNSVYTQPALSESSLNPMADATSGPSALSQVSTGQSPVDENGHVMRETMTDVQRAIEQLGRGPGAADGRSFSFTSSRDDYTDRGSETEGDADSQAEDGDGDGEGMEWHKEARQKLAAKAREAAMRKERAEERAAGGRMSRPPIDVVISDESEGEDEEDEEEDAPHPGHGHHIVQESPSNQSSAAQPIPEENEVEPPRTESPEMDGLPTATRTTFPSIYPQDATDPQRLSVIYPEVEQLPERETTPTAVPATLPTEHVAPPTPISPAQFPRDQPEIAAVERTSHLESAPTGDSGAASLPSPAASSTGAQQQQPLPLATIVTKTEPPELAPSARTSTHPSEWSVEDVVEWLKAKGFDQTVCEKFIDQEITGDVLLDIDVNVLKTEIGITQFGKRVRIANAISELRRPPSSMSDRDQEASRTTSGHGSIMDTGMSPSSLSGPASAGMPQTPATSMGRYSVQSSAHSMRSAGGGLDSPMPLGDGTHAYGRGAGHSRKESDVGSGQSVRWLTEAERAKEHEMLGPALAANGKSRPPQLALSPSDSALNASVVAAAQIPEEMDEEHGVVSENEVGDAKQKRRRIFGRSTDTSNSAEGKGKRRSGEPGGITSRLSAEPVGGSSDKRDSGITEDGSVHSLRPPKHAKKKSIDNAPTLESSGSRLSIFGSPFSGSLGKSRKPAPRYSAAIDHVDAPNEKSPRSLGRFSQKRSGRPGTSEGRSLASPTRALMPDHKESGEPSSPDKSAGASPQLLRKRTPSTPAESARPGINAALGQLKAGESILEQIGTPDHYGWMRKKGDRYNSWKLRYFVLKGPHLYCLRSNNKTETKIKGYIHIQGYRVIADENIHPGEYGFRIEHDHDKAHSFSSEEQVVIREWMKALMKATISRDYAKPVMSSVNIPTIPLAVAQTMNPAPRPPSPTARDATQKALKRENTSQLTTRDARVLMGQLPADSGESAERTRLDSFFKNEAVPHESSQQAQTPNGSSGTVTSTTKAAVPPRPSREVRRFSKGDDGQMTASASDIGIIQWANSLLPRTLQITDSADSLCGGLTLMRLAEAIKGRPASPPVPDSAFPRGPNDDKLDGLFRLFDFLLDNDVKMGSVSINDVRQGKRDKVLQLLKALKAWEDKKRSVAASLEKLPTAQGSPGLMW